MTERCIASAKDIDQSVEAATAHILKQVTSLDKLALIGIHTRGAVLATRIAAAIKKKSEIDPKQAALDINFYRDDLSRASHQPVLRKTDIAFSLDDLEVVLVDDVLYTGRTIRAALDALVDFGRPAVVRLFVWVDRGGRELPIQADWVAMRHEVKDKGSVEVRLKECDKEDGIFVV